MFRKFVLCSPIRAACVSNMEKTKCMVALSKFFTKFNISTPSRMCMTICNLFLSIQKKLQNLHDLIITHISYESLASYLGRTDTKNHPDRLSFELCREVWAAVDVSKMPPNNNALINMENEITKTKRTTNIKFFSVEEVSKHDSIDDCWVIENNNVYNVTEFLEKHPGGADLILSHGGKDVSSILKNENFHTHSSAAFNLLRQFKIGNVLRSKDSPECSDAEYSMDGWKEDMVDWNRGMVFQVHKLGKDYMKWVHSPVNKQLILFDSNFVEFFSKTPWFLIPVIWIPIIMVMSYLSLNELYSSVSRATMFDAGDYFYKIMATFLVFLSLFCMGLPVWTFAEYTLHRFLFHLEPKNESKALITLHFFLHGQHHKVPFDTRRLVFPPVAAACFAYAFYIIFYSILPKSVALPVFSGALLGYVIYDLMHYYLHHGTPERGSYLHSLKYYHILHHFDDHSTGYGISSKFWDYPFSTVNKKLL